MSTEDRAKEIVNSGLGINTEELIFKKSEILWNVFKSIEYYLIFHLTNEEFFNMDEDTQASHEERADEIQRTDKGIFYAYK